MLLPEMGGTEPLWRMGFLHGTVLPSDISTKVHQTQEQFKRPEMTQDGLGWKGQQ